VLDWLFYDVGNLSVAEQSALVAEANREGSILVVWPAGARGNLGVTKYADYAAMRAAPGRLLRRFSIAGVGSSDVGAAAFARAIANRYDEPVGAIVAGYGVADLLGEALGGWFVLGAANRVAHLYDAAMKAAERQQLTHAAAATPVEATPHASLAAASGLRLRNDTVALVRLLLDEDREIRSVTGHSKGCLSDRHDRGGGGAAAALR